MRELLQLTKGDVILSSLGAFHLLGGFGDAGHLCRLLEVRAMLIFPSPFENGRIS